MGVNDSIYGLVEAIKTTPEYSRLKQAKMVISKKPELKKELDDFNLGQKQLYSGKLSVKEAESRVQQLNKKLEDLSKIPEVDGYLKALSSFSHMMAKISGNINEQLEQGL